LSAGANDAVYQAAFDRIVCPIVEQFDPDLLIISAGFDAHQRDPLAQMRLSGAGYASMTRRVLGCLPRPDRCGVGIVLEGGYDLQGLRESMSGTLEALSEPAAEQADALEPIPVRFDEELTRIQRALSPHWRLT
jgi:acetoin utilization deacetylase AcuC-like enzyme